MSDLRAAGRGLEVLILMGASPMLDFLLCFLRRHRVTVARTADEARRLLRQRRYALALLTDLGIEPDRAVRAVPVKRSYPALFLTGHPGEGTWKLCRRRRIPWWTLPIESGRLVQVLRLALDDPDLQPEPEGACPDVEG